MWTAIKERKQLKVQWINEKTIKKSPVDKAKSQRLKERNGALYSEADNQVKRNARTDNRVDMDNLAAEAELTAANQE